jgi:hypothetical protein
LVGVAVGFSFSQISDYVKERKNNKTIIDALIYELSIARTTLCYAKNNKNTLPKSSLPIVTEVYDTLKQKLALILKPASLFPVQRAYTQIRQVSPIDSGKVTLRPFSFVGSDDVAFQHDLDEQINAIDQAITELKK